MATTNLGENVVQPAKSQSSYPASLTTQFVTAQELAEVERSFTAQKKLSFTFGAYFFLITLLIPFLSITSEWWYATPILGGLTLNFWTTLLLFHIVYWLMAYVFVQKANRLDEKLKQK